MAAWPGNHLRFSRFSVHDLYKLFLCFMSIPSGKELLFVMLHVMCVGFTVFNYVSNKTAPQDVIFHLFSFNIKS